MAKAYKVADWSFNESKKCFVSWLFCMGRRLLHNNCFGHYILYIHHTIIIILYHAIIYYTVPYHYILYHAIIYYTRRTGAKKVTAIQLYDMFSPCYSLEGSKAREKEVETVLLDEFLGGL